LTHTASWVPPHGMASYWFAAHSMHAAHPRSENGPHAWISKNPDAQLVLHAVHARSLVAVHGADSKNPGMQPIAQAVHKVSVVAVHAVASYDPAEHAVHAAHTVSPSGVHAAVS